MELHRSTQDAMIGGVCGGIAQSIGWSSSAVRWLYVLVSFFSAAFPGILVYIVLWIFMPKSDRY